MTNVIYNIDIPDGPNNPSQDQPKMKTNTNSLKSLIEIDHVGFGNNQGGYHKVVHLIAQIADPVLVAGVGQLYAKTVGSDQQLYYESGTGAIFPITEKIPVSVSSTILITAAFQTVVTLPNSVMGFITFEDQNPVAPTNSTFFFVTFPVVSPFFRAWTTPLDNSGVSTPLLAQFLVPTYDLQIRRTGGVNINSTFRYIYWNV